MVQQQIIALEPGKPTVSPEPGKLGSLLMETLRVQSKTGAEGSKLIEDYIVAEATKYGATVDVDRRNIYVTKGEAELYPCIVAHTDTVHNHVDGFEIVKVGGLYAAFSTKTGKQTGIGGDDKVGVAIALAFVRDLPVVKAAFFRDEEIGCIGSGEAVMSFFDDVGMVLEADRHGVSDVVRAIGGDDLSSDEFEAAASPILEAFGRTWHDSGGMTDVAALKRKGLKVSAINMSCGYFNPHVPHETVSPSAVNATYVFMRTLVREMGGQAWPHIHVPKAYVFSGTQERRIPTFWHSEYWLDDLDVKDPAALEIAWMMRAEVRRAQILEKRVLAAYQNNDGLYMNEYVDNKPITEWRTSTVDNHVVKHIKRYEDIDKIRCPACQFYGALALSQYDGKADEGEPITLTVVICQWCGAEDLITIEDQKFIGDNPFSDVPAEVQRTLLQDLDDDDSWGDYVTPLGRIHSGWRDYGYGREEQD